jgi:hypothetical protein
MVDLQLLLRLLNQVKHHHLIINILLLLVKLQINILHLRLLQTMITFNQTKHLLHLLFLNQFLLHLLILHLQLITVTLDILNSSLIHCHLLHLQVIISHLLHPITTNRHHHLLLLLVVDILHHRLVTQVNPNQAIHPLLHLP